MKTDKIRNIDLNHDELVNTPAYTTRGNRYYFAYEKVKELLAMACEDIYPDGDYGDVECCLWSEMRRILYKENLKELEEWGV